MSTLLLFHAHPDDETMSTGGTIARARAEGHRVVLVTATRGERGEVVEGVLRPGETLAERRQAELETAAFLLGVNRGEFLGYIDSGMAGTPENDAPGSFWQADIDEAAGRLAAILAEEQPEVFTIYDANGQYGHPDHIQVHRVGVRAAELAGVERVYEATVSAEHIDRMLTQARQAGWKDLREPGSLGVPEHLITTAVDVRPWLDLKRRAMAVHASQIGPESFLLSSPEDAFADGFATEWFIRRGAPPGTRETWLFEDVA